MRAGLAGGGNLEFNRRNIRKRDGAVGQLMPLRHTVFVPYDPDFTPDGIQFQPGTGRFKGTCHLATLHSPS